MAEIKDLSGTDANNTGTAANAGFPENMAYSDVNNAARALEGMIARHFADSNGTLTTTGSSNAYLLTPNRTVSAYTAGDAYMIKASFTNTGAVTINVSSLGAKSIVKPSGDALAAGELTSGGIYALIFDGTNFQMAGADDPENLTLTSLTVTGTTALNGNTTIGDAASDTVTITADVASDLIPSADGTHDLGAVGSEWQDLFIDGTANIDSLVADTADIDAGTIDGTVIGGNSAAAISGTTIVASTSLNIASDGATVTGIKDEDDMASDSATKLATQQSIKAYVDNQVTAQDLDFQADSGGALSVDLDSQTFALTGGTGIDTSGSAQTVTFDIDSTVATLTGSQTLTNKTLTSPVLNTGVSGTAVLDEDNMASNSATQLATQQSIKTYVDNQLTAEDLDFQADSGGALSVDLDSQTFTLTGGTGIDTVGANQTVTFNIDSTVATLAGNQTLTNKTLTSPVLDTSVSGTAVLDEDNMASDSATKLATQQSIKAYVDAQITAEDLDFQADSGGALSVDLDSQTFTLTGGTGIDTVGSGQTVTFNIDDSTVATLTATQTLTNKTLTSPDINTPDIDGGTIDNTVIGASTAAAGSFTTLQASTSLVDGTNAYNVGVKIRNNYSSVQSDWNIAASGGTSGWGNANGNFIVRDDTTNSTAFEAERGAGGAFGAVYVDANSKVGISTSSPSHELTIGASGADAKRSLSIEGTNGSSQKATLEIETDGENSVANFKFNTGGGTGTTRMAIDSSGNTTFSGSVTATSLIATNGVLELDDNGSHNGIINVPASLFINIDSDNGSTGEDFVIGKDRTSTSGGTELFRVQEDGNVGIGAAPDTTNYGGTFKYFGVNAGAGYGVIEGQTSSVTAGDGAASFFASTTGTSGLNLLGGMQVYNYASSASNAEGGLRWYTATGGNITAHMYLTNSGNLLVGKSATTQSTAGTVLYNNGQIYATANGAQVQVLTRTSTDGKIQIFYKDSAEVGSVSTNANSLPSDRNFKTNINDLTLGLDFVTSLKPVTYNYKIDDEGSPVMSGLIAQDVEESLDAAGVEKNSMTMLQHEPTKDEKQSDYQMDYLKLVPVLINAIKELQAEVSALKGA